MFLARLLVHQLVSPNIWTLTCSFHRGLRIYNIHRRKYCSKSRKEHNSTGVTAKTPSFLAAINPIDHKTVLARARKVGDIKYILKLPLN